MCYCTVFALFYFEFESNFQVLGRASLGGLHFEGLSFGILHYLLAAIGY